MWRRGRNPSIPPIHGIRERLVEQIRVACGCSKAKAKKVVEAYATGLGLPHAGVDNFIAIGLKPKEAERLVAAFELGRTVRAMQAQYREQLTSPEDAVRYVRAHTEHQDRESFVAILLDSRGRVMEMVVVSTGTLSQVDVHPRELFRNAVRMGAHSMIMAHNHPSGDKSPSKADKELTTRMVEVGKVMGIPVLDHIVVASNGATSMAARGWI